MIERSEILESHLWILLGSGLGGAARYWLSGFIGRRIGEIFPWGTLVVNFTGCFAIGFVDTLTRPDGPLMAGVAWRQFIMVGLCGGYTTFSSFSLQTLNLMRSEEWARAVSNISASVLLCLVAVWLGHVSALFLDQIRWV